MRRGIGLLAIFLCCAGTLNSTFAQTPGSAASPQASLDHTPIPLVDSFGQVVGSRREQDGRMHLSLSNGTTFQAPRFQRWEVSSSGRLLVGAGDADMPEHPFELQVVLYRDGVAVARPSAMLDPESSILVGDDSVVLLGHPPGDRDHWFVMVFTEMGDELYRFSLPEGLQARDPVFAGDAVVFRTHELRQEGRSGSILRADRAGLSEVMPAAGCLGLIGFADSDHCLLRDRDRLTLIDPATRSELWTTRIAVRPAGPHAYSYVNADAGDAIAILHSDVQRRGQPAPPVRLSLFQASDGRSVQTMEVARRGPLADARLTANDGKLLLEWRGTKEVLWSR